MIACTPVVHLVVALSMAAPVQADPRSCAAEDLRCSARAFAAAARHAESDVQRVQYLYFAHRAHLGLAEEAPEGHAHDLCHAKRLIEQALALPATSLRARVVESERVTLARLSAKQIQCKTPGREKKGELVAASGLRSKAEEAAHAQAQATAPETASSPVVADAQTQGTSPSALRAPEPSRETPPPAPTLAKPVGPSKGATPGPETWLLRDRRTVLTPPPGRRMLIAGGVSLASGLALAGAAAYTGALALDARREGLANMDLAASSENLARNRMLEDDYRRFGPVAVVTAAAGGAAVVAAVVLLCVGARRKARTGGSEPVLMPVRTGLLFTLKF